MNWPKKRIGDFLIESSIETSAPSAERRIRVRLNAEGIEKRPLIAETEGATRYFQRKAGQFIYGKQNLHKGAFGVVPTELDGFESSSDLPAFDVADGLRPEWLEYFLKQGNFYKSLVAIAKGAATKRIQTEALFAVELPVPPTKVQDEIIKRMDRCALEHTRLEDEITHQQSLLAKLKQAILQEAIQGKLTADWRAAHPDVEPASQLLHRIQFEKASLIAAKKLRKEKLLSKITSNEIPFAIPSSWSWCRFADVQTGSDAGRSPKCDERPVVGKEWGILKVSSTSGASFRQNENKFYKANNPKEKSAVLKEGDFILSRANTKELVGNSVLVKGLTLNLLLSDKTIRFRISKEINKHYANLVNKASFVRKHFILNATGASPSMKNLSRDSIASHAFPLPPLVEQDAIVERVEVLMTTCRALEKEIEHGRTHAAHLLQAVLKEAFSKET